PRGHLRISSGVGFSRRIIAPLLNEFQDAYPDVSIDLVLSDKPTNFVADQVDIAFRGGRMEDAEIVAKQIILVQLVPCASPSYELSRGLPASVEELDMHQCVNLRDATGRIVKWDFKVAGHLQKVLPRSRLSLNDADLVLRAVLDGQGIAQLPGYL